jgi:hypothetical protein
MGLDMNTNTNIRVYILATIRNRETFPYTKLIFDSLRVGFPTADVHITINDCGCNMQKEIDEINNLSVATNCLSLSFYYDEQHHLWIERLIQTNDKPFIICDTDVVFWENMESMFSSIPPDTIIAGRYIPEFMDKEFSGCMTQSRIHTSLMYINPTLLKEKINLYDNQIFESIFTPQANLYYPLVLPSSQTRGEPIFYDTMALAYSILESEDVYMFGSKELNCYDHFNFGTISDIVLARMGKQGEEWKVNREKTLKDILLLKGAWKTQSKYYADRISPRYFEKIQMKEEPNIEADPMYIKQQGDELRIELCKGNKDAEEFCNLWYAYLHSIDDLIDEEDADPLRPFFDAALLYKCTFYHQNESLLFPIILSITAQYRLSVMWEHHTEDKRKVAMADVLRMSGNQMFGMVGLIVGGFSHMNTMLAKIYLTDWNGQH